MTSILSGDKRIGLPFLKTADGPDWSPKLRTGDYVRRNRSRTLIWCTDWVW